MTPFLLRLIMLIMIVLLIIVMSIALLMGPSDMSVSTTLQVVLNNVSHHQWQGWLTEVAPWQDTVIMQVRMPRVLCAALVGASLAVSGAVLQAIFRNPLASPSILGVSSGASLGAVIAIFLGWSTLSLWVLPLLAFVGASVTLFIIYYIATYRGHTPIGTLLLSGVAVGAFNVSMSSLILALALQHWEIGKSILYWTMGGLDGRSWYHVGLLCPILLTGGLVILGLQRELDILMVGEIHASSVGVEVAKVRFYLLIVTALLTAGAVSVAGGIGFVGLIVPHIMRLIVGPHHRYLLPLSAITGAMLLVLADLLIRGHQEYTTIPLGVVTASLGAPFFVFLLIKQRRLITI